MAEPRHTAWKDPFKSISIEELAAGENIEHSRVLHTMLVRRKQFVEEIKPPGFRRAQQSPAT
jgi:hypothetical protein